MSRLPNVLVLILALTGCGERDRHHRSPVAPPVSALLDEHPVRREAPVRFSLIAGRPALVVEDPVSSPSGYVPQGPRRYWVLPTSGIPSGGVAVVSCGGMVYTESLDDRPVDRDASANALRISGALCSHMPVTSLVARPSTVVREVRTWLRYLPSRSGELDRSAAQFMQS